MGGHDQGSLELPTAVREKSEDLVAGLGVQVSGGLVGQDDGGFFHDGPGNGHALLFAPRKLMGESPFLPFQAHRLQGFMGGFMVCFPGQFQGEEDIFKNSKSGQKVEKLKDETNPPAAQLSPSFFTQGFQILPVNLHPTPIGAVNAGQNVKQGGFTGSTFPIERYHFPWLDLQVGSPQGSHIFLAVLAIDFPQIDDSNNRSQRIFPRPLDVGLFHFTIEGDDLSPAEKQGKKAKRENGKEGRG
jgi:hypothetical protein